MQLASALEECKADLTRREDVRCPVYKVLQLVSDDDRQALQVALDNPSVVGTRLTKALQKVGRELAAEKVGKLTKQERDERDQLIGLYTRMSQYAVQRHRRGGCSCPRSES